MVFLQGGAPRIVDVSTGDISKSDVQDMDFCSAGQGVVIASGNFQVAAINVTESLSVERYIPLSSEFWCTNVLASKPGYFLAGLGTGVIHLFEIATGAIVQSWNHHQQGIWDIASTTLGSVFFVASQDSSCSVVPLSFGASVEPPVTKLTGHDSPVRCIAATKDGSRCFSGSWDNCIRVWDVRESQCTQVLDHQETVQGLFLNPSETLLASCDGSKLLIWSLVDMHRIHTFNYSQVYAAFLNDSILAVSGGTHLELRSCQDWAIRQSFPSPGAGITHIAVCELSGLSFLS